MWSEGLKITETGTIRGDRDGESVDRGGRMTEERETNVGDEENVDRGRKMTEERGRSLGDGESVG